MSEDKSVEDRLRDTEELLRQVAAIIGLNAQPPDPEKAWRFERSLLSHFSDMRDSFHSFNNTASVMVGLLDKLNKTAENSAAVSRENREGIQQLETLSRNIESYALSISSNLGVIVREKPLLMRDLFWLETNTVEIGLILLSAGESIMFMVGSDSLVRSAMFRSLSVICASPGLWGVGVGLVSAVSVVSFACRKRRFRMMAAACQAVYFGVSGFLPLFIAPGVLGWLPHMLAWSGAFWILMRGPSDAPA